MRVLLSLSLSLPVYLCACLTISGSAGLVGAGGRSKPFNGARHHVSRFLAGSALRSVIVTSFGCPGTGLSVSMRFSFV